MMRRSMSVRLLLGSFIRFSLGGRSQVNNLRGFLLVRFDGKPLGRGFLGNKLPVVLMDRGDTVSGFQRHLRRVFDFGQSV